MNTFEHEGREYQFDSSPSIFMERNNPQCVKNDLKVRKQISEHERWTIGGSKDPDGTCWSLVGMIAEETGEVLRSYGMPPAVLEKAQEFRIELLKSRESE